MVTNVELKHRYIGCHYLSRVSWAVHWCCYILVMLSIFSCRKPSVPLLLLLISSYSIHCFFFWRFYLHFDTFVTSASYEPFGCKIFQSLRQFFILNRPVWTSQSALIVWPHQKKNLSHLLGFQHIYFVSTHQPVNWLHHFTFLLSLQFTEPLLDSLLIELSE